MASHQMSPELVRLLKGTVDRFNISSETYYHTVFLFNVIQLKNNSQTQPEYFTIPVRKINSSQSLNDESENQNETFQEPETQYIRLHHTQMPEKNKLDLIVCLFLVHKLYEPYPLCLSYLMRHLEIDEQFEEYIISLEMEFLVKLAYKIENLLPSNQAIFACHLWDQFIQNIDQTCIDVRFGINEIFKYSKNKVRTSHEINRGNIQPEFKTVQTQKSFDALSQNIQILVHNKAIYDFYIKKTIRQMQDDIPSMKKIGLAIAYVTIFQETNMAFNKKYFLDQKKIQSYKHQKNQYLEFVFNDFLDEYFGISLSHLSEQIQLIHSILQVKKETATEISAKENKKISSIETILESKSNKFVKFILKTKQNPVLNEIHYKFHTKCETNKSTSSTKTNTEPQLIQSIYIKGKCHSILGKKLLNGKSKHLESTLHQSIISEKASSLRRSISTKKSGVSKKENMSRTNKSYAKKSHKSVLEFGLSNQRSLRLSTRNSSSNRHGNQLSNSKNHYQIHEGHYKVSPFIPIDV